MPVSEGTVITKYGMRISTVPVDNSTKPSKHLPQILLFGETAQIAKERIHAKRVVLSNELDMSHNNNKNKNKRKQTKNTHTMQNVKIIYKENQIF